MAELKIVDVRQAPSSLPERQGKLDRFVLYRIDGSQIPYVVRVPDELSEAATLEAVKKDAAERLKLIGKTLTL